MYIFHWGTDAADLKLGVAGNELNMFIQLS